MKGLIIVASLTLLWGSALAQNTGPAPQTGMEKPGMTQGAKENGATEGLGQGARQGTRGDHHSGSAVVPPKAKHWSSMPIASRVSGAHACGRLVSQSIPSRRSITARRPPATAAWRPRHQGFEGRGSAAGCL